MIDKAVLRGYYTDESEKVFKPLRAFFSKQRIDAAFVAKVGSAADVIAEVANKGKFDLVMMGSHGHSSLTSLVMGSVTNKVMANCSTPVLVVR